jgi:peptidyl-tRNA hydrolase
LTDALAPLRERYAHWLRLDPSQVRDDREEAAHDIRAMQLVLRMERADPPSWHRALAAAATGAAALCADPRSEPGGEWFDAMADYCRGHIRKVTRRARGAHWVAAQDLPGITIERAGTQVRALLPGLVSELDPRISRLQVGGTDVAPDEPPVAGAGDATALRVWLAPTPAMTLGKAMAQAGHAGMIAIALLAEANPGVLADWRTAGLPAVARRASADEWSELTARAADAGGFAETGTLAVRDAGFTEVEPGTITVIAQAPGIAG